ncbi:hypothetical protein PP938_gp250 [Rhizobium phage AF3]|uniref:Uncharacterized protein n=1 Tax=Rhizobium phage AF3 TaxID=2763529 RepID=A0A7G7WW96_9CAUD|nr:hypothetical protein PP938_gp250 [Rhizobium phage AF3]QNH71490.1 hypothetical protein AF3_250 [Rhizobium phage AF3]
MEMMGFTNYVKTVEAVRKDLLQEYIDALPDDATCPCYIQGEKDSPTRYDSPTGYVIVVTGSYGGSGRHMRPFTHGIGKFLMKRGFSNTVEIETLGFNKDETRYDAETQTITKIEENEEYNGGFY